MPSAPKGKAITNFHRQTHGRSSEVSKSTLGYLVLVVFSLVGSYFSHVSKFDPGIIAPIAATLTLVLGAVSAFRPLVVTVDERAYVALGLVLLLGAGVELLGVLTGFPFGRYVYSDHWWPAIPLGNGGFFPLLVPLAWFLMAGTSYMTAARLFRGDWRWVSAPVGGLIAAIVDLGMEPVMAGPLGYWKWLEPGPLPGGAPIQNFLGWWFTATLAGLIMEAFDARRAWDAREPRIVLVGQICLTLGLGWIASH